MSDTVTVSIKGLAELGQQLRALGADVERRVARDAVRAGAAVIAKRAREIALTLRARRPFWFYPGKGKPRELIFPGHVGRSITVKAMRSPRPGLARCKVTVGKGKGRPYLVGIQMEHGNSKRAATPFMRPAWDQSKRQALDVIVARIRARVEAANKRA